MQATPDTTATGRGRVVRVEADKSHPRRLDFAALFAPRVGQIQASGIRKVFDLAAKLTDCIDLSLGQPHFPTPEPVQNAAIDAIRRGENRYTVNPGIPQLRLALAQRLQQEIGWDCMGTEHGLMVTGGTSGALLLAFMALAGPGDEVIIPDPYFVMYPNTPPIVGAKGVLCDTYPDLRMTADRIEPLLTPRTKFVLLNSPGNPSGVTLSEADLQDIVDLCAARGVAIVSDEIYDAFTYSDGRAHGRFPTPARFSRDVIVVRGFGKTYSITGWRMGYIAAPRPVIEAMIKLQQYSFVHAPTPLQYGVLAALSVDMSGAIADYARKRDLVYERLRRLTNLVRPTGAFYAFAEVPAHLGLTATQFVERAVEQEKLLLVPGGVFSTRDTHFRLSFATDDATLARGLAALDRLLR